MAIRIDIRSAKSVENKTVKNKNLSPRLKKLKKGILIKSPFKKKPLAKSA